MKSTRRKRKVSSKNNPHKYIALYQFDAENSHLNNKAFSNLQRF